MAQGKFRLGIVKKISSVRTGIHRIRREGRLRNLHPWRHGNSAGPKVMGSLFQAVPPLGRCPYIWTRVTFRGLFQPVVLWHSVGCGMSFKCYSQWNSLSLDLHTGRQCFWCTVGAQKCLYQFSAGERNINDIKFLCVGFSVGSTFWMPELRAVQKGFSKHCLGIILPLVNICPCFGWDRGSFLVAGIMLCLGFRMRIMLVTPCCCRCCWAVLILCQGFFGGLCPTSGRAGGT